LLSLLDMNAGNVDVEFGRQCEGVAILVERHPYRYFRFSDIYTVVRCNRTECTKIARAPGCCEKLLRVVPIALAIQFFGFSHFPVNHAITRFYASVATSRSGHFRSI